MIIPRLVSLALSFPLVLATAMAQTPIPNPLGSGVAVFSTFSCPGLPQPKMSGTTLVGSLPVSADSPDQPIRSLAIRISTSNDLLSGTNDDVWLDIGPKAWKIGDDFHRGTTTTIVVDVSGKDDSVDIPAVVPLYVRDISKLRIEKKGLCGLTDAPDSVASAFLPSIPTPAATIAALKQQVTYAQYALDQQQALVKIQQGLLDQQVQLIASAQQTVADAENEFANIPGQIANAQNQVATVQKQILQTPGTVASQACSNISGAGRVILGVLTGGGSELVCKTVQVVNPVWQSLTDTVTSLERSKNSLTAELQAAGLRKTAALQTFATSTARKAVIEAQKKKDELQYAASHRVLDGAQNALTEAEALAAKIPFPNVELPTPGQWKVDHVTLIVNGHELAAFDVGETLKQRHAEWSRPIRQMSAPEQFVRGLRVNVNKQSTVADERSARVTTVFKLSDISGWKPGPIPTARAIGVLKNPPSRLRKNDAGTLRLEHLVIELFHARS